jgi:hypothetical protein
MLCPFGLERSLSAPLLRDGVSQQVKMTAPKAGRQATDTEKLPR